MSRLFHYKVLQGATVTGSPGEAPYKWPGFKNEISDQPEAPPESTTINIHVSLTEKAIHELGIGLDLGTASTGLFTVIDGDFERGVPQLIKCPDGPDRDKRMSDMVIHAVQCWSPKPTWAAIEEIYMGDNVHTLRKLQALRTRVEDYLKDAGIIVYAAYTAQIDSACGIAGHLKRPQRKKATRRFAETLYGKLPEDPADALCVAYYGYHERRKDRWLAGDVTP